MPPSTSPVTVSQAEAARLLGVSTRTVRRRVASGVLPAVDGRPLVAALPDTSGQEAAVMAGGQAPDVSALLAGALERAATAETRVRALEHVAVLVLDGRLRARRRARRELRDLLYDKSV